MKTQILTNNLFCNQILNLTIKLCMEFNKVFNSGVAFFFMYRDISLQVSFEDFKSK